MYPQYAGKRSIVAIEHNFIPELGNKLSRGAKAILQGPIRVKRGALLLVPGNIWVIGGQVDELDAQMQALSQAVVQQPVGQRGPSPTLQQHMANLVHTMVQNTGAALVAGANGSSGGIPQGGRPVQPVSPELPPQQQAPQQRMPDSPRQLQQQQAPPLPNGNTTNTAGGSDGGVFMPSHPQQHGSISFGSGNVPPIGAGVQQQQPGPTLTRPAANKNHPLFFPPANEAEGASSGEGWSADPDDDDGGRDQPGAGAAAVDNFQQHQEVIETLEVSNDEETQPFQEDEDEHGQQQLSDGQPQPYNTTTTTMNRTRVVDSPNHETPRIPLGNTINRDDIESSSQEDGHREFSIPWKNNSNKTRSSSGKLKIRRKRTSETGLNNSPEWRRKSTCTSPQITIQGMDGIPHTEPQDPPLLQVDGVAANTVAVASIDGRDDIGDSNEKMKRQRLYSAGKSKMTTNIYLNTVTMGAIDAIEPSPRAKAALIKNFNQVSNPVSNNPDLFDDSPGLQLPAAAKLEQVSPFLMAHPPGLDQIKAGDDFQFPHIHNSPPSPVASADVAAAEHPRQHDQQQQEQHHEMVNNDVYIQEWGSQGAQPFTYLYHLANYIDAVENSEISTAYPISATVQGSIVRIIDSRVVKDPVTNANRVVIKVLVQDATGNVEAVLSEVLVLDLINEIFKEHATERNTMNMTADGTGTTSSDGNVVPIIQASSVNEIFRLNRHHPELVKNALGALKPLLQKHYGLLELMKHGPEELPQIVQLLDLKLTSSQIEVLRARVQHGGRITTTTTNNNNNRRAQ